MHPALIVMESLGGTLPPAAGLSFLYCNCHKFRGMVVSSEIPILSPIIEVHADRDHRIAMEP